MTNVPSNLTEKRKENSLTSGKMLQIQKQYRLEQLSLALFFTVAGISASVVWYGFMRLINRIRRAA